MNPYRDYMQKQAFNRFEAMVAAGKVPIEKVRKMSEYATSLHPQSPIADQMGERIRNFDKVLPSGDHLMETMGARHLRKARGQMRMESALTDRQLAIESKKVDMEGRRIDGARGSLERLFRQS